SGSPFTAVTGGLGEGENGVNTPPHQHALALARLLLEAGADPNHSQTLYNRQWSPADDHLELLGEDGLGRGIRACAIRTSTAPRRAGPTTTDATTSPATSPGSNS